MKARLEIPADSSYVPAAVDFALACADRRFPQAPQRERLRQALACALELVLANNRGSEEPVGLELGEADGRFVASLSHRGVPIAAAGPSRVNAHYYPKLLEVSRLCDELRVENRWRRGQELRLAVSMGPARSFGPNVPAAGLPDSPSEARHPGAQRPESPLGHGGAPPRQAEAAIPDDEPIAIKNLEPGEEEALSRLFYLVYGYEYVNPAVYSPERLKAMLESGELLSTVAARANGRLVGHVGLVQKNAQPRVYEAAMGVVDPAVKSRGLFGSLFKATMDRVRATPMSFCLFDLVTNHDLTQRHVERQGATELALLAGCQSRETQASLERLGLGEDPAGMDRYSLLLCALPREPRPFGRSLALPDRVGQNFGFLLEPFGLEWTPAPRFEALGPEGRYSTACEGAQAAVHFDLEEPGLAAAESIVVEWRELLREGYEYADVTVPLDRPGLGALYEHLGANGFFAAGFVPYRMGGRLAFRFQAIGHSKIAFDQVRVASARGRRLLELVRADYEASCLI